MSDGTTYDVRIYRSEVYKGVKVTTYQSAGRRATGNGGRASGPQPKPTASEAPS